jgi:hypothetical protein
MPVVGRAEGASGFSGLPDELVVAVMGGLELRER